jgi:hypothetical protein
MRVAVAVLLVVVALPIGFIGLLAILWLVSFVDPAPAQDDCAFDSVSKNEYLRLLAEAKAQDWTVWPGLSKGILLPSDRLFGLPDQSFEPRLGERLRRAIDELAFDHESADAQLAAAHAVMRGIRAEYVSVYEIPGFRDRDGKLNRADVEFTYFFPQRRFAPLCLHCLLFDYTTIAVYFGHDLITDSYGLDRVTVLNGELKYDPRKEQARNISDPCPAFPRVRQQPVGR